MKKVWNQQGGDLYLEYPSVEHEQLENAVYTVKFNERFGQFYLVKVMDKYTFDYKLYGLESALIERFLKTYANTTGNLGMLLNGTKGTGKTVTSKIISNKLNQPTIVVSVAMKGVQHFLNSIPQDVTIFVDEYEKVYGQSNELLTIMDGAMNSEYRRVFLLTTNKLYIEDNLKQRPSRLRYMKTFDDLTPDVVEEIVDDILIHKELKDETIKFITTLELITVDIVKEILNEVNIHKESPENFGDIFNVKKLEGKYKVYNVGENGEKSLAIEDARVYPRPDYVQNIANEGYGLEINGKWLGRIVKVIDKDTVVVKGEKTVEVPSNKEGGKSKRKKVKGKLMVLKIEKTYGTHYSYDYGDWGGYKSSFGQTPTGLNLGDINDEVEEAHEISIQLEEKMVESRVIPIGEGDTNESAGLTSHEEELPF